MYLCFFKQKTAYDMRISDWSSDGCSSDLAAVKLERAIDHRGAGIGGEALGHRGEFGLVGRVGGHLGRGDVEQGARRLQFGRHVGERELGVLEIGDTLPELLAVPRIGDRLVEAALRAAKRRSEEHTSELQSLMRNSYAVFCLK